MKQVIQNMRTGALTVEEVPPPQLRPGGVLVRSAVSLVSAGTERMTASFARKNLAAKAMERPDLVRKVLRKVEQQGLKSALEMAFNRLDTPLPLGYSCAGTVVGVGAGCEGFRPGERVACAGFGYAAHAEEVYVPRNLVVRIPQKPRMLEFAEAAYVTVGAIALQGVRVADLRIGEVVAVIGLGLIGQLTVQILKASGCVVIGADLEPDRIELAESLGCDRAVSPGELPDAVAACTEGRGADAVIITAATESNAPVEQAGEISRLKGRVVVVGAVRMDVPRKIYYEKELALRLSMSYGPGRYDPRYEEQGIDYPYAYVPWTENRNMALFLDLVARGGVDVKRLTTHTFEIGEAEGAYRLILGKGQEKYLGVLLTYPRAEEPAPLPRRVTLSDPPPPAPSRPITLGMIGAGNYARSVLLPAIRRREDVEPVTVVTATGPSAATVARRFGFRNCATDPAEVIEDPQIDALFIATRHNLHAPLLGAALRAGKAVWLEKPLALTEEELAGIVALLEDPATPPVRAMVGFNRRYAPLTRWVASRLKREGPVMMQIRVNAGPLPPNSWILDPVEGGGRIRGEVCHFVDLLHAFAASAPVRVFAEAPTSPPDTLPQEVSVTIRFADGSIGTILYAACGDPEGGKEYIEIMADGAIAVIDDFRYASISRHGKKEQERLRHQDKGQSAQIDAFFQAIRENRALSLTESIRSTLVTLKIEESLRTGAPILLGDPEGG